MMLVFPEGAWEELLPESALHCQDGQARQIEWSLRSRLYTYHHFQDDTVLEAEWVENAALLDSGWGLEPVRRYSAEARGAFEITTVLKERADIQKLRYPELIFDEKATQENLERLHDLLGTPDHRPKGRGAHLLPPGVAVHLPARAGGVPDGYGGCAGLRPRADGVLRGRTPPPAPAAY
jgi:hypothetical protein